MDGLDRKAAIPQIPDSRVWMYEDCLGAWSIVAVARGIMMHVPYMNIHGCVRVDYLGVVLFSYCALVSNALSVGYRPRTGWKPRKGLYQWRLKVSR